MRLFGIFALFAVLAYGEKARFDNYRVYTVVPQNEQHLNILRSLEFQDTYNFWTSPTVVNTTVDIMVPPHSRDTFHYFLEDNHLPWTVKIEDIQSLIDEQEFSARFRSSSMEWTNYHRLEEIYTWMDELAQKYPKIVKTVVGGKTYEGREIKGLEIKFGDNLTGVILESGIHAREWIGPAATTWMVNELVTGKVDPILKKFNYVYFPSANPDGYEYTWTENRLWRKTRQPHKRLDGTQCYGADPNRNWGFHWGEIGSSKDPCSETYGGSKAFSEPETKSLSEYIRKVTDKLKVKIFLAYHSYSQLILYPWGYTTKPSKDDNKFYQVALAGAKALTAVHDTDYIVGTIAKTIYPTSGTSIEWYYGKLNATISMAYELRDKGLFGFLLPPAEILPTAEETLASLVGILSEYEKLK